MDDSERSHPVADHDTASDDVERLKLMESEQAELNRSLLRLTTHFAQVQFRLKQIVAADSQDKEILLRDLEEFAFQGCPDTQGVKDTSQLTEPMGVEERECQLEQQRQKQQQLVAQLQLQLEDLEQCTEESVGSLAVGSETGSLAVKQKYIIEKLKRHLNIKLDGIESMSPEELKTTVDVAVGAVTRPARSKEQTIQMLRTQVADLERYINFLQASPDNPNLRPSPESPSPHQSSPAVSGSSQLEGTREVVMTHARGSTGLHVPSAGTDSVPPNLQAIRTEAEKLKSVRDRCMSVMKRSLSVMQVVATTQVGLPVQTVNDKLTRLSLDKREHPSYAKAMSALQLAIDHVITVYVTPQSTNQSREGDSVVVETEPSPCPAANLLQIVRKELGNSLLALLSHGLKMPASYRSWLNLLACFSASSQLIQSGRTNPWLVFLHYYHLKQGDSYNASVARTLSVAFNVDVSGGNPVTAKQTLLSAIHHIKSTHEPLRKGPDSQFRSLVCAGLNVGQLGEWCQLMGKCTPLIDEHYHTWACVATGFEEASACLERLSGLHFSLPVDQPIQQLTDIRDAFSDPL